PELMRQFELDAYFDLVVGIEDVSRPKPAPDMLLHCLEQLAVAPHEAVYVGDSPTDQEAAVAAGMPFIAVGAAIECELRIATFDDLPRLLGIALESSTGRSRPG